MIDIMDILILVVGIIPTFVTVFSIDRIFKTIATKKYGEKIEATVVKAVEVNAKGSITYNIDCEFLYNGKTIQKSEGGMREKNIYRAEKYIGKKYKVLYHPKYDYMVIEQEYKKTLYGGIMMLIIGGFLVITIFLTVLSDMGYINL
jgi:hypothetical protein